MVRSLRVFLLKDAAKLVQLFHEIVLHMQAPGRIEKKQVPVSGLGGGIGVEGYGGGIGSMVTGDDLKVETRRPALELLGGGGSEGIAGAYEHGIPGFLPEVTQSMQLHS